MDGTTPPLPGRLGRYRIERQIGEGGMGIVYAAHDDRLGRTVALKALRGPVDDASRERLWREARAAAAISHPNICQLYEVEETSAGLVLAMELLTGEPLAARLERGPVPATDTASIALQALSALEALHEHGLVHRDLKPSNLFLTPHGVKLLDFGLVRSMGGGLTGDAATRLTEIGTIPGTPQYMAPEQIRGEPLDARSDLFSLAAVLFEMLSGQLAFNGATIVDVLHAVLHEQPPALSGGGTVAGLDRIIHKALHKSTADRYPTASAMAQAIRSAMAARSSTDTPAAETRPMTRLVALPFRVLRPDPDTDFLAFSLPDAITSSLAGTPNLLVRSSAAAARFDPGAPDLRQLAADADVDVALMGTILRAGNQLRASAQLVEAPAGTVLWSHSAQSSPQDVFALQDELVSGIVGSLAQSLGGAGATGARDVPKSAAAYELFLRANGVARDFDHTREARDLYRRCVELDPDFAPAWAALGRCWRVLGKYFGVTDGPAEAERAFDRAQRLNPDLPSLHNYYAQFECDAGRAVDAMRRLLRQSRRLVSAEHFAGLVHACRYTGLLEASLAAHDEARRLDPTIRTSVHNTQMMLGDYEQLTRDIAPGNFELGALALFRLGRGSEAAAIWRNSPSDAPAEVRAWDDMMMACFTGAANARALAEQASDNGTWGDPEGAMASGAILSHLGSPEYALRLLRAAVDGGYYVPAALLRDPWLDPLRGDRRFAEILALAHSRSREARAVFRAEGGERLLGAIADAA
jgi:serine/threonine protein kinase/tetratricopeptide (TPR) repeat protein